MALSRLRRVSFLALAGVPNPEQPLQVLFSDLQSRNGHPTVGLIFFMPSLPVPRERIGQKIRPARAETIE